MSIPLHETLNHCKKEIESKLDWGVSSSWKQRDYERLSGLILKETDISISLSTLRRLWKPDYAATPHPSTLEALAGFAGYESWHHCQQATRDCVGPAPEETPGPESVPSGTAEVPSQPQVSNTMETSPEPSAPPRRLSAWLGSAAVVAVLAVLLFSMSFHHPAESFEAAPLPDLSFDHRTTVDRALPNTVIFDFNLGPLDNKIAFFQQSWNDAERIRLSNDQRHHSAVYYYPGFHRARLLVDERIVADRRVHIQTEGWVPLARYTVRDTRPFYLSTKNPRQEGVLGVSPETLAEARLDLSRNRYWVSYFNVRDFENVDGSNFTLTTRLRNRLEDGGLTCQQSSLFVFCENGVYLVSTGYAGCVSDFSLWLPGKTMSGKKHDLSALAADLSDWRLLSLTADNGAVQIHIDDRLAYEDRLPLDAGPIKGLQFRFLGTGSVDWVELQNIAGETIYRDDF